MQERKREEFQHYCSSGTTEISAAFYHFTKTEAGRVKNFYKY